MNVAELSARLSLETDRSSFKKGDGLIGGVKKALGALAAAASVRWFAGVINGVVQTADHLDELSQQTGVNVESLQALGYAAGFSGVSTDELAGSLGKFSKNADAAAKGSKTQARAFRAVGVDAKALIKGTLPLESALGTIAGRFKAMKDGPKKAALAMTLFGRSGKALIPFLNAGPEGIANLTKEARELGVVIDAQHVKEMAELADDQDRLKAGWQGIKNEIAIALLPVLKDLTHDLLGWAKANRKLIASKVVAFVRSLGVALKIVAGAVGVIGDALAWLADILGTNTETLGGIIIALKLLGPTAMAAGGMLEAAFGAAALPIALVAALIAGVIYVLSEMTFDEVVQKVKDFLNWAKDTAGRLKDWFENDVVPWAEDQLTTGAERVADFLSGDDPNASATSEFDAAQGQLAATAKSNALAAIQAAQDAQVVASMRAQRAAAPDGMTAAERATNPAPVGNAISRDDSGAMIRPNAGALSPYEVSAQRDVLDAVKEAFAASGQPYGAPAGGTTITSTITVNEAVNARETARLVDERIQDSIRAMVDSGFISAEEGRRRELDAKNRKRTSSTGGEEPI